MSIVECRKIDLPKIQDPRGNLTFIENNKHIPFDIKRIFYLYDVPGGETRAGHALKTCQQFVIAVSGSFDIVVDDGVKKALYSLNRSFYGLYIPALVWRELENFSSGSVCLVLASETYDADSYYRTYEEFKQKVKTDS
jgi:dTDP-4-dehydrorhamnose 3,5-epimerase-like enzyme